LFHGIAQHWPKVTRENLFKNSEFSLFPPKHIDHKVKKKQLKKIHSASPPLSHTPPSSKVKKKIEEEEKEATILCYLVK